MLLSLEAVGVEGAGMKLAVPRAPQRVSFPNEFGHVLEPSLGYSRVRVHVKGSVYDVPSIARVRWRTESVFVEQR